MRQYGDGLVAAIVLSPIILSRYVSRLKLASRRLLVKTATMAKPAPIISAMLGPATCVATPRTSTSR